MSLPAQKESRRVVLDEMLANAVISGVQKTLATMFGILTRPGQFTIVSEHTLRGDVSGIVGMIQEKIEAVMIVSFEKDTIFHVLGKMYKRQFSEVDSTIKQGVGELTNIIYGQVKRSLNEKGYDFKSSIPNVVVGTQHTISNIYDGKSLVIPFDIEGGRFYVEVAVQHN